MFVGEGAFQDENFLSAGMRMCGKRGSWRIAYKARRQAERFVAYEKATLNSWCWRRLPEKVFRLQGNPFGHVGV
jgi:hypothetical protein